MCFLVVNKEVYDVYSAFFMPVQRVFGVLRYSLSSGVAFSDSRGVFERFILGTTKKYLTSEKVFLILKIWYNRR